jgi:hypothetical protein
MEQIFKSATVAVFDNPQEGRPVHSRPVLPTKGIQAQYIVELADQIALIGFRNSPSDSPRPAKALSAMKENVSEVVRSLVAHTVGTNSTGRRGTPSGRNQTRKQVGVIK